MGEPTAVAEAHPKPVVLAALWRGRWVILGAVVLAGIGGYLLTAQQASVYGASSKLVLEATQPFQPLGGQTYTEPNRYVANQVAILGTDAVLERAAEQLGDGTRPRQIGDALEVHASGDDDVIAVTVFAPSADAAADRADAVVAGYRQYVEDRVAREVADAVATTGDPAVADQIMTLGVLYGDGVSLTEPADRPQSPSSPNPLRNGFILAAIAGLLSAGVALWRRPPATVSSSSTETSGSRILGAVAVPVHPLRRKRPVAPDPADFALSLVSLDYARRGTTGPVLVTGTAEISGAAPVAQGLAVSAAAQGRRVLLVDAEPGARELLCRAGGEPPVATLDAFGNGGATQSEVLVPRPVAAPGAPDLQLAMVGTTETGPMSVDGLRTALDRLAGSFDLILLQVGPVAESPLAFSLVSQAEVVVAAMGVKDDPDLLGVVQDRVVSAERTLVGVIMTRRVRIRPGAGGPDLADRTRPGAGSVTTPELSGTRR